VVRGRKKKMDGEDAERDKGGRRGDGREVGEYEEENKESVRRWGSKEGKNGRRGWGVQKKR